MLRAHLRALSLLPGLILAGCASAPEDFYDFAAVCAALPNEENARLPLSPASDDWFQVYESAPGVYSIAEPYQAQGTISHLVTGTERALLFDTGIGLLPIRPVVERLTDLPVTVLNSHTHYDHVGGNAEFSSVLAIDSDYTRANMRGFTHERIAGDFAAASFCDGPPPGVDLDQVRTRPWRASAWVADGDVIDLGGRRLEVMHIPGHTPDAVALLDAANGLLFTGDSFYDDEIWLFVPETSLQDYANSLDRLVAAERDARFLLGAHTSARVEAGRLAQLQVALAKLRAGEFSGRVRARGPSLLRVGDVEFMISRQSLAGQQGDLTRGGSGLDTWP
jgi:glyoxylase-like metal-dependent hydrolase (beta-lactamase superfamily II)